MLMKIPKYVIEMMERAEYQRAPFPSHEHYAAGYTIRIHKATARTHVKTFRKEIEKLCAWANRKGFEGTAFILIVPEKTHYYDQSAVVTIYDPIMQQIERYISDRRN